LDILAKRKKGVAEKRLLTSDHGQWQGFEVTFCIIANDMYHIGMIVDTIWYK